jgi:hypothetical protein
MLPCASTSASTSPNPRRRDARVVHYAVTLSASYSSGPLIVLGNTSQVTWYDASSGHAM